MAPQLWLNCFDFLPYFPLCRYLLACVTRLDRSLASPFARSDIRHTTNDRRLTFFEVMLDGTLTYCQHLTGLWGKVTARSVLIRHIRWGTNVFTLKTSTLALVYAPAKYSFPVGSKSTHSRVVNVVLNSAFRTATGCIDPTPFDQLPVLASTTSEAGSTLV